MLYAWQHVTNAALPSTTLTTLSPDCASYWWRPYTDQMPVRTMLPTDSSSVISILGEGIDGRNATFETLVQTWEQWDLGHHSHPRLVFEAKGEILGWAALSPTSTRAVYQGVAEVSVYVRTTAHGMGVGTSLLATLAAAADTAGMWTLQSSIFPENTASQNLHERIGFRVVGRRERIAQLDGEWRDTLLLERRSNTEGSTP